RDGTAPARSASNPHDVSTPGSRNCTSGTAVLGTGRVRLGSGLGSGRGPGFVVGRILSGGGVLVFRLGYGRGGGLGRARARVRFRGGRGGLLGREPGDIGLGAPR